MPDGYSAIESWLNARAAAILPVFVGPPPPGQVFANGFEAGPSPSGC
jgi:hypothetical protein